MKRYRYRSRFNGVYWSPALVSTTLWLDATDESTITESGGAVSTWADKSGNGNDVTQGTGSNQPTTGADIGGNNALDFDGGDHLNALYGKTLSAPNTIFVVHSYDSGFYFVSSGVGGDGKVNGMWVAGGKYSMWAGVQLDSTTSASTANTTHMGLFNGVNSEIYINGELEGTGNVGTQTPNSIGVGARAGSLGFNGRIGEVLVINSELSESDRQKVEGYLAWKWNNTANLPVGHPYKTDGSLFGY